MLLDAYSRADREAYIHAVTMSVGLTAAASSGQAQSGVSAAILALLLLFARWHDDDPDLGSKRSGHQSAVPILINQTYSGDCRALHGLTYYR